MVDVLSLPGVSLPAQAGDRVLMLREGALYLIAVDDLHAALQPLLSLGQGVVVGKRTEGTGAAETLTVSDGVAVTPSGIVANGTDHLTLPAMTAMDVSAEIIVNSAGHPKRVPFDLMRQVLTASINLSPAAVIDESGLPLLDEYGAALLG